MSDLKELVQNIKEGLTEALPAYIDLKKSLDELQEALSEIQPLAISEAQNYPEKSFKLNGAIVEKRSTPAQWDYSQCEAYIHAKNRLSYIQKIAQAGGGADTETGEVIDKAVKIEGKESIAIKFT